MKHWRRSRKESTRKQERYVKGTRRIEGRSCEIRSKNIRICKVYKICATVSALKAKKRKHEGLEKEDVRGTTEDRRKKL